MDGDRLTPLASGASDAQVNPFGVEKLVTSLQELLREGIAKMTGDMYVVPVSAARAAQADGMSCAAVPIDQHSLNPLV